MDKFTKAYKAATSDILVSVRPVYLEDESTPEENRFVWAYQVQIENQGGETVQLLRRYWQITDSLGRTQEVQGDGVVGEQPVLSPGEVFEYTSGAPLETPSGFMVGKYHMIKQDGSGFEVDIPAFSLDSPHDPHSVH